ncbi:MAG: AsmA-like C-terminal region-containing protein, partial [Alphaproteobacteria bacterium]|nr:AsmA-like C-terminal region-containing protein [Alphaproteobacteria bacterium]
KDKGIEGHFESEAVFKGGTLHLLKHFDFMAGDTIAIKGNANFSPSSSLPTKVSFETFKLGKTLIKPMLERKNNKTYKLTIKGGTLDLEAILDQLEGEATASQVKESFEANIKLDQLYLLGEKPLRKVIAEISHTDGLLRYLNLRGFFKTGETERTLFATLHSPSLRQRILEVSTNHFGELMQSLSVSDRLLQGRLALTATHNNQENSPWVGRFKVYNFSLKDPPVLGQLLSLAFPTGLVDLVSDKGMPFSSFSTRFKYMPHLIQLSEGRAKGSSLGLTISGSIIPKTRELKLQGTLMPAYFLNTLIGKIPLLGEIITGGKDEGIFGVTYTVAGRFDKPEISVNPLSVLTPGLIRKIFSTDEEEFEEDTDPLSNTQDD